MFSSTSITYQQPCLQTDTQLRVSVSAEVVLFKLREHHHIGGNNVLFRIYFPAPKKSKLVYVDTWSLKNCLTLPKPLNSGCGIDADIKSMVLVMDLPWYLLWGMSWSLGCENLVIWKDPPIHVGACFPAQGSPASSWEDRLFRSSRSSALPLVFASVVLNANSVLGKEFSLTRFRQPAGWYNVANWGDFWPELE